MNCQKLRHGVPAHCHASRSARRWMVTRAAVVVTPTQRDGSGLGASGFPGGPLAIVLFYRSQWPRAVLHGSLAGGPWKDYTMHKVPSGGGKWHQCVLELPPGTPVASSGSPNAGGKPLLEFVTTNKQGAWEKGANGSNFQVWSSGRLAISGGNIAPVTGKRVMVVSDLDGTMVGDDGATKTFRQWWEDSAVPRGGVMVYNTGRSLDSFQKLQKDKAHCLAVPDALITAVGTKVYNFDGSAWQEDKVWSSQLDEDWALRVVIDVATSTLVKTGKEVMHFRPPEEQNEHKVTCGVSAKVVDSVCQRLTAGLRDGGVTANVIVSGHGDWRYVDIVPVNAGKLAALNWVATRYGFRPEEVVACGDSGNDILMLAGENPAIVVGNAQPDLRNWYQERRSAEPAANGPDGKERLLMTSKHEALGILEGLQHWGFK